MGVTVVALDGQIALKQLRTELQYPVIIKKSQVLVHSDHPEKGWEGVEQEWRAVYQGDKVKHGEDDVGPMEGVGNYVERKADAEPPLNRAAAAAS